MRRATLIGPRLEVADADDRQKGAGSRGIE